MPAYIARSVVSTSVRDASGTSPTMNVRAESPCQPSTIAPASIDTIWPSRDASLPGTPWTISSSIEMHRRVLNGAMRPGTPMNDGMAPAPRIISSAMASSSSVVMPGRSSGSEPVEHVGDQRAGDGHLLDLRSALERHAAFAVVHARFDAAGWAIARSSASVTSSIGLIAVDGAQHAAVGVVVDDLEHRRQLLLHARA